MILQRAQVALFTFATFFVSFALSAPTPKELQAAEHHFAKAKESYKVGNYKVAREELLEATKNDPDSSELVINLATVCEKLGSYDEALSFHARYRKMKDVTAEEMAKSEASSKRIEGAKTAAAAEEAKRKADEEQRLKEAAKRAIAMQLKEETVEKPGKFDAINAITGGAALVSVGVGTGFLISAFSKDPSGKSLTPDYTYKNYSEERSSAKSRATVATVGFVTGGIFTVATAILYFGRTHSEVVTTKKEQSKTKLFFTGDGFLVQY